MRNLFSLVFTVALIPAAAGAAGAIGCGGDGDGDGDGTTTSTDGAGEGHAAAPGPLNPETALRAAVLTESCFRSYGINSRLNGFYTDRVSPDVDLAPRGSIDCFAGKTNGCDATAQCLGVTAELATPCSASCDGDVYQYCEGNVQIRLDCGAVGKTCTLDGTQCIADDAGMPCDDRDDTSCRNEVPHVCVGREVVGPACASFGLTCGETGDGFMGCVGAGPACKKGETSKVALSLDKGIACDGVNLRTCVNGFEHLLDCASLGEGFTCQTTPSGSFCGLDTACTPGPYLAPACDGDSVVVCNAGRIDRIDCKSLGFTSCDAQLGLCAPTAYTAQP